MFVAVVPYILLIIEGEVWNVKAEVKAMNLRTGSGCLEYTDGILRHKVNSLLPVMCETSQLFFSVSASYSSFTWGTKLLP